MYAVLVAGLLIVSILVLLPSLGITLMVSSMASKSVVFFITSPTVGSALVTGIVNELSELLLSPDNVGLSVADASMIASVVVVSSQSLDSISLSVSEKTELILDLVGDSFAKFSPEANVVVVVAVVLSLGDVCFIVETTGVNVSLLESSMYLVIVVEGLIFIGNSEVTLLVSNSYVGFNVVLGDLVVDITADFTVPVIVDVNSLGIVDSSMTFSIVAGVDNVPIVGPLMGLVGSPDAVISLVIDSPTEFTGAADVFCNSLDPFVSEIVELCFPVEFSLDSFFEASVLFPAPELRRLSVAATFVVTEDGSVVEGTIVPLFLVHGATLPTEVTSRRDSSEVDVAPFPRPEVVECVTGV